jgi:wyosine [tRNA(Phe)-imidazoG37] synthetase (radical SAM superfamily)
MKASEARLEETGAKHNCGSCGNACRSRDTAFGCPRGFRDNQYVYTVISPRAAGLVIGVNMNPARDCNFDCVYCEVSRNGSAPVIAPDLAILRRELENTLNQAVAGNIQRRAEYHDIQPRWFTLRHVALSGDGEPTLCPNFAEIMELVMHLRATGKFPFFKIVLITNATGLHLDPVRRGLEPFNSADEIWAKLDGGTQEYLDRINQSPIRMESILENILSVAKRRPVVIQSLFPAIQGRGPSEAEIDAYAGRLRQLKEAGGQIPLVQIYSATRPSPHSECGHLPLQTLSIIARRVRELTGLATQVF